MDDLNEKNNPFSEEKNNGNEIPSMPAVEEMYPSGDNAQKQKTDNQQKNPYNQWQNPYNQQPRQNPYNQQYNQHNTPQRNPYIQPGPYGYQNGYQQGSMPVMHPSTGFATASMVLGIISLFLGIFVIGIEILFALPVLAVIFGIIHKSKRITFGDKSAVAGIITGIISLAFMIFYYSLVYEGSFMRSMLEIIREGDPELYEQYYEMYYDMFPQWFGAVLTAVKYFFIR